MSNFTQWKPLFDTPKNAPLIGHPNIKSCNLLYQSQGYDNNALDGQGEAEEEARESRGSGFSSNAAATTTTT